MKKSKKATGKSYLKIGGQLLIGGMIGALAAFILPFVIWVLKDGMEAVLLWLRQATIPLNGLFCGVNLIFGLIALRYMRRMDQAIQEADEQDEEADEYEYRKSLIFTVFNLTGYGMLLMSLSLFAICTSVLTKMGPVRGSVLVGLIILLVILISVFQVRMIQIIQQKDPSKQGDPLSLSFQRDWLKSCDEAEREVIYQASYHTHQFMQNFLLILFTIAVLAHVMWQTGLFPVAILGIAVFVQYLWYSIWTLKLEKIN